MKKYPTKEKTVWERTVSDGKWESMLYVKVVSPIENDPGAAMRSDINTVSFTNYLRGPRGGYSPSVSLSLSKDEWAEMSQRVRQQQSENAEKIALAVMEESDATKY